MPLAVLAGALLVAIAVHAVWSPYAGAAVPPSVTWALRMVALVVGATCLWWSPSRGGLVAVLLVLTLAVWVATAPQWTAWAPETRLVRREHGVVWANAVTTLACLSLAGGRRGGVRALRVMWVAVLATTVPVGVWEVVTHGHLVPAAQWRPPPSSPAATFGNPNNFAVVLTVGVGIGLLGATERLTRVGRVAWLALAAVCGVLVWFTLSRAAVLACAIVVVLAGHLWLRRVGWDLRARARHRPWVAGALVTVGASALVASFTVPPLAAVNPVLRIVAPRDAVTAASDGFRLRMIATGLEYWRATPWFGIGIGRFDVLVRRHHPEFGGITSMHKGLVEMLVEFGLVVAVPLAVLLAVLAWRIAAPARGRVTDAMTAGRPAGIDPLGARHLAAVYLVAFVQAGIVVSSSVPWTVWWLLLASAAATTWWVGARAPGGIGCRKAGTCLARRGTIDGIGCERRRSVKNSELVPGVQSSETGQARRISVVEAGL